MSIEKKYLLELQYLGSIRYFSKFLQFPTVCIEQHEHFQKGSYRNRCFIAGANGQLGLSIPLAKGKNQQQAIREVRISYEEAWQSRHWQSIQSAYGKSPFFEYYQEEFSPLFQQKIPFLFDWNWQLLETCLAILDIKTALEKSEAFEKETTTMIIDLRNTMSPKPSRNVVDPHFHPSHYRQVFEEKTGFLPNLSILDLIFCTGPEAVIILEKCIP